MTRIWIYFIVFVSAIAMAACSGQKEYKIGVSQCSQDDWRTKMNDEINREIMMHEDATVEIRSADDSNEKQIADIRYFVDNGFDIIVVAPNEAEALTPIIQDVYSRGIPVIIFDRNINGDSYTARIGVDDEGIGRSAARYARHMLGDGIKVIEIQGLPGSTPAASRHKGFVEEFEGAGGEILAGVPANWNQEDAVTVVDSLLNIYDDVDLIYAHNDRMAIGASEVAYSHGRRDIRIIGIDAAPEIGIKAVADTVIDATFLYPTEGHRIIQTALSILKGEPYDRETILPASSAVDLSNADILLLQNDALLQETRKMRMLKDEIDRYWAQHSSQTSLFYASIAIIGLLFCLGFMLLRAYWQRTRHQRELTAQNRLLQQERDKQQALNERLQAATQSKLMFFTNVSHDLRTPLTLIAEPVAQLSMADNLNQSQRTLVKIADKNVRILRRLINQILDFRKYENGKLDLRLAETDFSQAVRGWMESFYGIARERDIALRLDGPGADTPVALAIDAEKIERVFFNLLSNAFKHTGPNGSITVTYRCDASTLTFSVADTGEGIAREDLDKIFDRFFQADSVHPSGSGIGLSLAKAFVELHGGSISVESAIGKGATFTVSLPVTHAADAVAPTQSISSSEVEAELSAIDPDIVFDNSKPLLLVIDDNKDIQTLVSELLNDSYNIITASNGKSGLRKASKYIPDLVICDVMMPEMDGMECCSLIKRETATSHIPVLMLTACSMDEQRACGYKSGADGYLSKPFSGEVLRARCESLISNRKRIKQLWSANESVAVSRPDMPAPTAVSASSDPDNEFYARFLSVFQAEIGNPDLNVDMLASRMGLERSQFYRKIKALTNYAPVELIRKLRLRQARSLITGSEKTISEIAYELGFSSPAYFTKCYRDAYGETPTETRAKTR